MQRGFIGAHAGIAADQVQLADRHIQHRCFGVFQVQNLLQGRAAIGLRRSAHVQVHQAPVAANAVGAVHHRVTDIQLGQVLDQGLHIADLLLFVAAAHTWAGGKQLGLGDQVQAALDPGKALLQSGGGHAPRRVAGLKGGQVVKHRHAQAAGAHKVEQALAPACAFGQDQHPPLAGSGMGFQVDQGVGGAAQGLQTAQRLNPGVVGRVTAVFAQGQLPMVVGGGVERLGAQKQAGRGQHRALGVAAHQAVALLGVLPKVGKGRVQVAMQSHQGLRSQVVKHGRGVVKKQGQVVLNARGGHAIAHVFVDAAFGRVALEQFAPAAAKFGARRLVHGELATGQ